VAYVRSSYILMVRGKKIMLPKEHFFVGLVVGLFLMPFIEWYYILVIIAANVLIDFDHYMTAVVHNKGDCSLKKALEYYRKYNAKGKNKEQHFDLFHTIEAHILILLMTYLNIVFLYVFLGMLLHSLTDILFLIKNKNMYQRQFLFYKWWKNVKKL